MRISLTALRRATRHLNQARDFERETRERFQEDAAIAALEEEDYSCGDTNLRHE